MMRLTFLLLNDQLEHGQPSPLPSKISTMIKESAPQLTNAHNQDFHQIGDLPHVHHQSHPPPSRVLPTAHPTQHQICTPAPLHAVGTG